MSRSVLLVICDFLLLSLLALARFDKAEEGPTKEEQTRAEAVARQAEADLVEVLQLSLEGEAAEREALNRALAERDQTLQQKEQILEEKEEVLREQAQTISQKDEEARRLAEERARLEKARQALSENLSQAASQLQERERSLQEQQAALAEIDQARARLREDLAAARERQRALQEQLQARDKALEETQNSLELTAREREELDRERAILATRLESEAVARERLELELQTTREEKRAVEERTEQLAAGVSQLAEGNQAIRSELKEEIRQNTPLSLNQIYTQFTKARVPLTFNGTRRALIGTTPVEASTHALLVTASNNLYALFETGGTPLAPDELERMESLSGSLSIAGRNLNLGAIAFLQADPRIAALRLPADALEGLDKQAVAIAEDPLRFPEAVLTTADAARYGEAPFKLHTSQTNYIEVENRLFNRLFGEFAPGQGDIVFAKTGGLIGFMINNRNAALLNSLTPQQNLTIGPNFSLAQARQTAARLLARTPTLP